MALNNITVSILLSSILAGIAFYQHALTRVGLIIAWMIAIIITYCGGTTAFIILALFFLVSVLAGKISPNRRTGLDTQKDDRRNHHQVLANAGIGALSLIIFYFTTNDIYLIAYACIMAESLADSISSEVGVLSRKMPINIMTFKKSPRGTSGAISILGLIAALIGAFIIAITFYIITDFSPIISLIVFILGFIGSIIDSMLGATIQVKYRCEACSKITEKSKHCGKKTNYFKGCVNINNDMVNFLSNLIIFILSVLLLSLII